MNLEAKLKEVHHLRVSYLTMYKKPVYKGIKIGFGGISVILGN